MINSWTQSHKGYRHFHVMDFVGVAKSDMPQSTFNLSLWPDGVNGSNEPDACAMVTIEEDWNDGEEPKDMGVLVSRDSLIKLRDLLNERFPA